MKNIILILVVSVCCGLVSGCTSESAEEVPKVSAKKEALETRTPEQQKAWKKLTTVNQEDYFKD
ncbi:MAG: hypothetical protein ACERJ1_08125 [Halodesulfovibrio sp.]|uniref:hypothetical protein n=1 Tax=Halodesulfovibrio sp. TaxID=1912772 RepID=UPI00359CDEED